MEWIQPALDWWNEYYPIVIGFVTTISTVVVALWAIWSKVKPVFDKLNALKETVETNASSISPLERLKASSLATDLKAKLDNPTISDSLKLEYQQQLFELDKLIGGVETLTDKAQETTDNYL